MQELLVTGGVKDWTVCVLCEQQDSAGAVIMLVRAINS